MKLHEIIAANDSGENKSILIELMLPYKRSLLTYYKSQFNSDPVLMVTAVFNAAQYGIIVPSSDIHQCLSEYLDAEGLKGEDREAEWETILFNSIELSKL